MSPKVIFIPSSQGKTDANFYQEASQLLSQKGFETYLIEIKNSPEDYASWQAELDKIKTKIDTETYLIAHSSGGLATLRFLSENDLKIKSLNLVATPFDENLVNSENKDFVLKQAKSFKYLENGDLALDFEKINQNCEFISFHYSKDDRVVDFEQWKEYKKVLPNGVLIKYLNEGHFKNSKIEKLEEFILNQEENSWTEFEGKKFRVRLISDESLPLVLPEIEDYQPNPDGRSPLAKTDWIEIKNENGEVVGRRESDVMPNWAGSSWYYLRYCDPKNPLTFASQKNLKYWLPVDHYFGGNEHTTMHLLYSRFWHRFLYDQGYVPTPEPYKNRTNGGILLGPDGNKMSKSKGNVINPKEVIEKYGADALRLYIAFIGPYDATVVWQEGGLKACGKLVDTIFKLEEKTHPLTPQDTPPNPLSRGGNIPPTPFQGGEIPDLKTKHLIFDFDGVLGDTQEVSLKTIQEMNNVSYDEAKIFQQKYFDKPRHGKKNRKLEIKTSKQEMIKVKACFDKYTKEFKSPLFQDFITEIKKIENAKLAIVSSGFKSYISEMLKNCDLEFDFIYDFETSHSKEEKVEMVCKNWGVSETDCFYFTDTKSYVLELKEIMPLQRIIGCSWGWQGFDKLKEVLPENQILKEYGDVHNTVKTIQDNNLNKDSQKKNLCQKTKHLIFDFDGVLGDTQEVSLKTIQELQNITRKEAEIFQQEYFDKPKHSKQNSAKEIKVHNKEKDIVAELFTKYIDELQAGLFDGFIKEVKKIKNAKLAIVTSGIKKNVKKLLADSGLEFDYIYDVQDSLSKEEKVEMVCKNWGVSESDCFYFTDTKSDVLELKEIMPLQRIIGCSWGWQGFDKLKEVLPENQILREYKDIHNVLKRNDFYTFNGLEPSDDENIDTEILTTYHKFIQKITSQLQDLKNNVAVAEIMTFTNYLKTLDTIPISIWSGFLKAIAPFAVFTTEELWFKLYNLDPEKDFNKSIHLASYPKFNPELCIENEVTIAVQVNGKVRAEIKLAKDTPEAEVLEKAKESVAKWLEGKELKFSKVIPNKIVTLAVK